MFYHLFCINEKETITAQSCIYTQVSDVAQIFRNLLENFRNADAGLANKSVRDVLILYMKNNIIQNNSSRNNCLLNPGPFQEKYTQNIALVNYCHLCIDYKSNMFKIFKKSKKLKYSSHQLQQKVYNILLHLKFKVNPSVTLETQTGPKCTCPTVLYLSFQFRNNNSIIISMSEN